MEASSPASFNHTYQALFGPYPANTLPLNLSDAAVGVNITRTLTRLTAAPLALTLAVLLVFVCSPMILIGNSLVLVATCRFKRLRTPSNYLVMSLAVSDLGVGVFMPVGMYLELGGPEGAGFRTVRVCLVSYGVAISLCSVSVLVMVAIAVDRFTSLARPLRYNNLITHSAMERYIAVFWAYSSLVGFTPLGFTLVNGINYRTGECSFGGLVAKPVQLFMFCAVYGPSALVVLVCYGYIYFIARGHARAISEVRHALHHNNAIPGPRYGLALAITAGMFVGLWLPFQLCMLMDVFLSTNILSHWTAVYLALPILASSAINPWVYGYRNSELRCAVRRVVDDILTAFGFTYRSRRPPSEQAAASGAATVGDPASFIHHVQRFTFNKSGDLIVMVPMAKAESSDAEPAAGAGCVLQRIGSRIGTRRLLLRSSKSMIETLAVCRGSSALVVREGEMVHGASVV